MQADRITLIVPKMSYVETDKTIPATVTTIVEIIIEIMEATTATGNQDTTIDVFTITTTIDIDVILATGATSNDRCLRIAGVIRRIRNFQIIGLQTTARLTPEANIIERRQATFCALNAAVAATSAIYASIIRDATATNVNIQSRRFETNISLVGALLLAKAEALRTFASIQHVLQCVCSNILLMSR